MPDYIDVTDQCTFSPDTGTPVTQSGDVTVSYVKDGVQLTNTIHVNAYPRSTFNMPYNISESIRDCNNLFNGCSNFCQSVILPSSASNCAFTFNGCTNFKGDINIPSGVHVTNSMFNGCSGPLNINFNLQLDGMAPYYDVYKMCARSGITKNRININFTGQYYNASETRKILGNIVGSEISFENNQDNHCYYNTSENLYIYGLDMTVYEKILDKLQTKGYPNRTIMPQLQYPSNRLFDAGDTELVATFTDGTVEYVNYQTPGLIFSPFNHDERVTDVGYGAQTGGTAAYYTYNGVTARCELDSYSISSNISFNKPYRISNVITNCNYLFDDCINFNSTVNIGKNVKNCVYMFRNCVKFDQSISIPENTINCFGMFAECHNFNKPIQISNKVIDVSNMFNNCNNLHLPFGGDRVINIYPNQSLNVDNMFRNVFQHNYGSGYIRDQQITLYVYDSLDVTNMIGYGIGYGQNYNTDNYSGEALTILIPSGYDINSYILNKEYVINTSYPLTFIRYGNGMLNTKFSIGIFNNLNV